MPVAKTYAKYAILDEPYIKNGRKYVHIRTGSNDREVRWYSNAEYEKMYGVAADSSFGDPATKVIKSHKDVLGFKNGYITIFKGDTYSAIEWFREKKECRYSNLWGWYVTSEEEVPVDVPTGIETLHLDYDKIFESENKIKTESEIKAVVEEVLYSEKIGEFVGEVGDRVEVYLNLVMDKPLEGYYGMSHMYKFTDDLGNIYMWTTNARTLNVGETYNIRGTIKELKVYKGERENILTRCKVM